MKINDNRKSNYSICFGYLDEGNVFEDCNGSVWMKIEELNLDDESTLSEEKTVNAISLDEGSAYFFPEEEHVLQLNVSLEIKTDKNVLHTFSDALEWMYKGGAIRHVTWDLNTFICLGENGNFVQNDGVIVEYFSTTQILSNEWILIKQ